jgi:hypothetical protein
MDERIQLAIESAYAAEKEHGLLSLAAMRSDATFVAAERLAETGDPAVLKDCPEWLLRELHEWVSMYRQNGRFGFISNLGEADHSQLLSKVAVLLPVVG